VLKHNHVHVGSGPRENNTRPAIDPLFRSAAVCWGAGAIGVILTGNLYDGTAGLLSIKAHGGTAIVQHPDDAVFPSMPESALREVAVDHCVPLARIPALLVDLVSRKIDTTEPRDPDSDAVEVKIAEGDPDSYELLREIARPSAYTCPECHGALWEVLDDRMLCFRCRVGHAYTAESLLALQDQEIEMALWSAVRSLEERAALARRMIDRADLLKLNTLLQRFRDREQESEHHANVLRQLLMTSKVPESEA
jgi:two-component system chemotaxis response regulator CheB